MSNASKAGFIWKINDHLVDLSRNVVSHLAEEQRLEPKAAGVLAVLIENENQVVSRGELLDRVWRNAYGADQSLTNSVSQLRKCLDHSQEAGSIIETVPKRGYRLVAEVVPVARSSYGRSSTRLWTRASLTLVVVVLICSSAAFYLTQRVAPETSHSAQVAPAQFAGHLGAYEAFERGREAFQVPTTDNLRRSIGFLEQAIAQDPSFAAAWAELAVAYHRAPSWLIRDRDYHALARGAAKTALGLDPAQPLAHAVLGVGFVERADGDFLMTLEHLDRALQIDPNNATALQWRGIIHTATGFFDRAETDLTRCVELHPANGSCRGWRSFSRLCAGDIERAFELFEAAAEDGIRTHLGAFAKAYAADGQRAKAILTWAWDFSGSPIDADRLYRAHTDPAFDFATESVLFAEEYSATNGHPPNWGKPGAIDAAHTFKRYDDLEAAWWYPVWWLRMHDDFLDSGARMRLMERHGLFDYWDQVGPPHHCAEDSSTRYICK